MTTTTNNMNNNGDTAEQETIDWRLWYSFSQIRVSRFNFGGFSRACSGSPIAKWCRAEKCMDSFDININGVHQDDSLTNQDKNNHQFRSIYTEFISVVSETLQLCLCNELSHSSINQFPTDLCKIILDFVFDDENGKNISFYIENIVSLCNTNDWESSSPDALKSYIMQSVSKHQQKRSASQFAEHLLRQNIIFFTSCQKLQLFATANNITKIFIANDNRVVRQGDRNMNLKLDGLETFMKDFVKVVKDDYCILTDIETIDESETSLFDVDICVYCRIFLVGIHKITNQMIVVMFHRERSKCHDL